MEKNPFDYERHKPVYSAQFVQKPADLAIFFCQQIYSVWTVELEYTHSGEYQSIVCKPAIWFIVYKKD